jgi:hypothetical protein
MKLLRLVISVVAGCCGFTQLAFAQATQMAPNQSSGPTQSPSTGQTKAPPQIGLAKPVRSPGDFDRGIYLKKRAGNGTCGAIVSYNFSPGESPSLQSVTTCTPANPEAPLRTGHEKQPGPPALQLRKAVLESVPAQK